MTSLASDIEVTYVCFSLQYHMLTEHGKDVDTDLQCSEDEFIREYEVDPYSTHCLLCRNVYPDFVSTCIR